MFIQCKDMDEVESVLLEKKITHAFVTEDFRIHDKLHLVDPEMLYEFHSKTALGLYDLQSNIGMMAGEGFEQSFLNLEENAKLLTANFKVVLGLVGKKPIKKLPRNMACLRCGKKKEAERREFINCQFCHDRLAAV